MRHFLFILAIILPSLLSYYVSMNLILTIIVSITLLLYFIFLEILLKRKTLDRENKHKDLNIFIHDFLLSYFDGKEIKFSIKNASINVSNSLKEELRVLDEYSGLAILSNLENYFVTPMYSMFLSLIKDKSEESKNNLNFIYKENDLLLIKKSNRNKIFRKKLFEFTILWICSFIIFAILRLSLNNYFKKIQNNFYYIIGVSLYFLIFFLSINLFVFNYYQGEKDEK